LPRRRQSPAGEPAHERKAARFKEIMIMTSPDPKAQDEVKPQRLHLVFGGELKSIETHEFRDLAKIDIVGLFPDYASAEQAWRAKAQATVDQAQTRYFVVHLHRLLEPDLAPPTRTA
jgi:Domain of unknown function (DUF4170)